MIDFFMKCVTNDNVGTIANAHLAWADKLFVRGSRKTTGIFSAKLKNIAWKYSVSLDFAKRGGEPVRLSPKEIVHVYPDFMEKYENKDTYVSENLLGQLYHTCLLFEMCVSENEVVVEHLPDPTLCCLGWEEYEADAERALGEYEKRIGDLLAAYNIPSEAELVSGCLSKCSKYLKGRDESWDLMDLIGRQVKLIFDGMQQRFWDNFDSKHFDGVIDEDEEKMKMASAWYMVPYRKQSKVFGLPWTISEIICGLKVATSETQTPGTSRSPLVAFLDSLVPCHTAKIRDVVDLNIALDILHNWADLQQKDFFSPDSEEELHALKEFVTKKFSEVLRWMCRDGSIQGVFGEGEGGSLGRLIVDTLQSMSEVFLSKPPEDTGNKAEYELSMLALMTLGRIACQRDVGVLGLQTAKFVPLKTTMKLKTVKFRISLKEKAFARWAVRNTDLLKETLVEFSEVEELEIEPKQRKAYRDQHWARGLVRNNQPCGRETANDNATQRHRKGQAAVDWYFLVTARGHAWAVQQLRMFATSRDFQRHIMMLHSVKPDE